MKKKHLYKIVKYIEKNDVPKLKYLTRKHRLNLSQVQLEGCNTLLHLSCDNGYDDVVRYLLKSGCDCLLVNEDGDLPIHKACVYATECENPYVYQDLLQPLINACPESVYVANRHGKTAAQQIDYIKAKAAEEEIIISSDEDKNKDAELNFKQRLQEEMSNEYYEQLGQFEEAFSTNESAGSCEDWMNKIASDRKRKMQESYTDYKSEKKIPSHNKKPKISEEQQKCFEKNIKDIYKKELTARADKSVEEKEKLKSRYEENCQEIFSRESRKRIGYTDIPWPHMKDQDINNVESFLFGNMQRGSEDYKKYLREQQIRWHPDRFLQKCGERMKSRYKEKIMNKVKEISQLLNSMIDMS